jgi:hypothetical protein
MANALSGATRQNSIEPSVAVLESRKGAVMIGAFTAMRCLLLAVAIAVATTSASRADTSSSFANSRWHGSIRDTRAGRGVASLDFPDGVFREIFAAAGVDGGGSIEQLRDGSGSSILFLMRSSSRASCVYTVKAQIGSDGDLSGTYQGCGNGTFTLSPIKPRSQ